MKALFAAFLVLAFPISISGCAIFEPKPVYWKNEGGGQVGSPEIAGSVEDPSAKLQRELAELLKQPKIIRLADSFDQKHGAGEFRNAIGRIGEEEFERVQMNISPAAAFKMLFYTNPDAIEVAEADQNSQCRITKNRETCDNARELKLRRSNLLRCTNNDGKACLSLGVLLDRIGPRWRAAEFFQKSCSHGSEQGCEFYRLVIKQRMEAQSQAYDAKIRREQTDLQIMQLTEQSLQRQQEADWRAQQSLQNWADSMTKVATPPSAPAPSSKVRCTTTSRKDWTDQTIVETNCN